MHAGHHARPRGPRYRARTRHRPPAGVRYAHASPDTRSGNAQSIRSCLTAGFNQGALSNRIGAALVKMHELESCFRNNPECIVKDASREISWVELLDEAKLFGEILETKLKDAKCPVGILGGNQINYLIALFGV